MAENIEKIFEQFLSQAKENDAKELILELKSPVKILTAQGEKNLSENSLEAKELLAMTQVLARGQIAELKEKGVLKKAYEFKDFGALSLFRANKPWACLSPIHLEAEGRYTWEAEG